MCKEIGNTPGKCPESARLTAIKDDQDYDDLSKSNNAADKVRAQKYIKQGQEQYLAALHFEGL